MNAIEFVEIVATIKESGNRIKFLSKDFIRCEATRDRKTGRSFSVCYELAAGKWEGFVSFSNAKLQKAIQK